jgi:prophage tail gpP-like protein
MRLLDIARALAAPFAIVVEQQGGSTARFDTVACEQTETVLGFLAKLAQQQGSVLRSNRAGALVISAPTRPTTPVAINPRYTELAATFDPQSYFSVVTGVKNNVGRSTVNNPRLSGVTRPHTYAVDDTQPGSVWAAVQAKVGRMLASAASYTMTLPTWLDATGALWEPGTIVRLQAPRVMIYEPYDLLVRSVALRRGVSGEVAELELVIPEAYTGGTVGRLPWE